MFEQVTSTFEPLLQQVQRFQGILWVTLGTGRVGFRGGLVAGAAEGAEVSE